MHFYHCRISYSIFTETYSSDNKDKKPQPKRNDRKCDQEATLMFVCRVFFGFEILKTIVNLQPFPLHPIILKKKEKRGIKARGEVAKQT
jgi:hypothetical protein